MTDFERLKEICRVACHERNACRPGFEALMRAETVGDILQVWRQNWQDIYQSKFADVMAGHIVEMGTRLRREFRRNDVFVNESSDRGLVIVCRPKQAVRVGGRAQCYVFGDSGTIEAADHAQVYCRNSGVRIVLRGYAYGRLEAGSADIGDRAFLQGTPDALQRSGYARFEGTVKSSRSETNKETI